MRTALLLSAILTFAACSLSEEEPPSESVKGLVPVRSFEQRLERAFHRLSLRKAPVLVQVVHDGATHVREFGAPARDRVRPEATLVDLNSITKTITAIVIAKLVDERVLAFDDTLASIFRDVPADKRAITVHQLLTHTAGLREALGDDGEVLERDAFVRRAMASRLIARPGERYHYSNAGYGLLAAAVELKTGVSYETYLRKTVLRGLDLPSIGYEAAYHDALSLRSEEGETIREASWGGHAPSWHLIGNGGLVSTVRDFCRLRQLLGEGAIVSDEMVRRLHTPYVREDPAEPTWYGYGVVVQDIEGVGRVYQHDGGNDVYSAVWAEFRDQGDLLFTAAADSRRGDAFEAMQILAAELYGVGR